MHDLDGALSSLAQASMMASVTTDELMGAMRAMMGPPVQPGALVSASSDNTDRLMQDLKSLLDKSPIEERSLISVPSNPDAVIGGSWSTAFDPSVFSIPRPPREPAGDIAFRVSADLSPRIHSPLGLIKNSSELYAATPPPAPPAEVPQGRLLRIDDDDG